jgi:valyl-tRNA synthetase
MKDGRRLAIKVLNASKFTLGMEAESTSVTDALDLAMLASLRRTVDAATEALDAYEHAKALEVTERFFWGFTDDYLELVKHRAYGVRGAEAAGSAVGALRAALDVLLRAFAPFLPYATEEVWSWWREGSVHRSPWPLPDDLPEGGDPEVYGIAADVLTAVRRTKALAKLSLRAHVRRVVVRDTRERLAKLALAQADLCEAGNIEKIEPVESDEASIEVELDTDEP